MINPIVKAISTFTLALAGLIITFTPIGGVVLQSDTIQNIAIYNFKKYEQNNLTIYQYDAQINNQPVIIQLEINNSNQKPEIIKKKEKTINKEDNQESHQETEYEYNSKNPGKIKIIFKDSKQQGTTLIYERDMSDGEISPIDQKYIEQVLNSVEKFHRDNHTLNDKIRENLNKFWKNIQKKK